MNLVTSTRASYLPDIQGSVIASIDASSGTVTKTGYQTYGESSTTTGTFRYTGARIDAETNGLYNFRARMYSPTLGRFMQVDPIRYLSGINLYRYVRNDPLNLIDPLGLTPDLPANALAEDTSVGSPVSEALTSFSSESAAGADTVGSSAIAAADAAQAAGAQRGVAGSLQVGDQIFTDISSGAARQIGQTPTPVNPIVQGIIEGLPEQSPFPGSCAEIACISQAIEAGVDPPGGRIATAAIRAVGNPVQGTPVVPCVTCSQVLRILGISY